MLKRIKDIKIRVKNMIARYMKGEVQEKGKNGKWSLKLRSLQDYKRYLENWDTDQRKLHR